MSEHRMAALDRMLHHQHPTLPSCHVSALDVRITYAGQLYEVAGLLLGELTPHVTADNRVPFQLEAEQAGNQLLVTAWSGDLSDQLAAWTARLPRCTGWIPLSIRRSSLSVPPYCRVRVTRT